MAQNGKKGGRKNKKCTEKLWYSAMRNAYLRCSNKKNIFKKNMKKGVDILGGTC